MELFAKGGIGAKEESYTYSGEDFSNPRILVMGCGTAGSDMVKRLEKMGASGAEILAIDADLRRMERIGAEREILIGREGEGTGGDPAIRRAAAGRSLEEALGAPTWSSSSQASGKGPRRVRPPPYARWQKITERRLWPSSPFRPEQKRLRKAAGDQNSARSEVSRRPQIQRSFWRPRESWRWRRSSPSIRPSR